MIKPIGLYIHVPFCVKKCPYCDFYSVRYDRDLIEKYVDAVVRNLIAYKDKNINIDSIYFGGGTPSLLSCGQIGKIVDTSYSCFNMIAPEVTIEVNPTVVDTERFKDIKNAGVNRISFGVQSLNDIELKALGRLHNTKIAVRSVTSAFSAGFQNISADLMLGIKSQTSKSLAETIDLLTNLPVTHISAYMLSIEEGTPFDDEKVIENLPKEDEVCGLYLETIEKLALEGFNQYEISNFAKIGYKSRHNLHYWNCDEYIGIGPSAHSYFKGKRYAVDRNIEQFLSLEIQKEVITDENPGTFEEYSMLKMRLSEGINISYCKEKYNINDVEILEKARKFAEIGLVIVDNGNIRLTPKGCLVSNRIISELFG